MINKGIYCIKNTINNKLYIGSSKNINKRKQEHFSRLRRGVHKNVKLQASYNKHGEASFIFEILETNSKLNREELLSLEQNYIDRYEWDILYNLVKVTGNGGSNITAIDCLLLNLRGDVIKQFESIAELSRYLNVSTIYTNRLNKNTIISKDYRIVSVEFYNNNNNNIDTILSWDNIREKQREVKSNRSENYKNKQVVIVEMDGVITEYTTKSEAAKALLVTPARIRQLLKNNTNDNFKIYCKYPHLNRTL